MEVGGLMSRRVDPLPCVGLDGSHHRHRRGCLPIVARSLPPAPAGWVWEFGPYGVSLWGVWLRRVGGVGSWWPVGVEPVRSVGALVLVIHALGVGARPLDE